MIGRVLVLAQVLSEWGAFGADGAGVLSYCPRHLHLEQRYRYHQDTAAR